MPLGITAYSSSLFPLGLSYSQSLSFSSIRLEDRARIVRAILRPVSIPYSRLVKCVSKFNERSPEDTIGVWEDPDEGSDSDSDIENDSPHERDWFEFSTDDEISTPNISSEAISEEELLIQEVEELLSPEEMRILEHNRSPNTRKLSSGKWKQLHTLALSGKIKLMDKLIEEGLDIEERDKDGFTPLHMAVIGKKEAVVSHLLRKGANLEARDRDGASPLHYAVHCGAVQTVKLLIKHNVNVNIADDDGWTPLHVAVQGRNRDLIKLLLINGADKNMRNKDGRNALDLSLCFGREFNAYDIAKLIKLLPKETDDKGEPTN